MTVIDFGECKLADRLAAQPDPIPLLEGEESRCQLTGSNQGDVKLNIFVSLARGADGIGPANQPLGRGGSASGSLKVARGLEPARPRTVYCPALKMNSGPSGLTRIMIRSGFNSAL